MSFVHAVLSWYSQITDLSQYYGYRCSFAIAQVPLFVLLTNNQGHGNSFKKKEYLITLRVNSEYR